MSTNLERRIRKLEGSSDIRKGRIYTIIRHESTTNEDALAAFGIERKPEDMCIFINTYGGDVADHPPKLTTRDLAA